ncbi:hypothetical protein HYH02_011630 [Chlamydomonas schloesseri]|uniref:Uncharacterized protein n=1 Tax=Chlamydomonas schloesseri TaxID=2026947 RepID=A0A835W543_9CHLO|nr:hypothetical protein HYH02_011630 [Chlamydomonas schloesseri]|eukprot:KAG2436121.1 hypothetical protein HYH02_011630 [Chlamydomonas schloesseri]
MGSWGRRTLVPGAFDVDLVAYVSQYRGTPLSNLELWRRQGAQEEVSVGRMRRDVKDALQRAAPEWSVKVANDAHYGNILRIGVGGVEVDLLLLPELLEGTHEDPVWEQHKLLTRPLYANPGAAAYDQVRERADAGALSEYVRGVHDDVKGVIRLVKGLYKNGVLARGSGRGGGRSPGGGERIRSFSLKVLVLAADQSLQHHGHRPTDQARGGNEYRLALFLEFLRLVVAAVRQREVVMVDAGRKWGYSRRVGQRFAHCWRGHDVRIIHPIDPTCNLERPRVHRAVSDWEPLVRLAERLLDLLLRRGGTFADFVQVPEVARALRHVDCGR